MAYSLEQKIALVDKIANFLEENKDRSFTSHELVLALNLDINAGGLTRTLSTLNSNQLKFDMNDVDYQGRQIYKYGTTKTSVYLTRWEKEKSIITFFDENDSPVYTYDFSTKEENLKPDIVIKPNRFNYLFNGLKDYAEWCFSYPEKLTHHLPLYEKVAKVCPKNYVKFLDAVNEDFFSDSSYNCFIALSKNCNNFEQICSAYSFIKQLFDRNSMYSQYLINHLDLIPALYKIAFVSLKKNLFIDVGNKMRELIKLLDEMDSDNPCELLDTNRDFAYNEKTLDNIVHKEFNSKLANNLQKLNFINNQVFDDYVIIVPQTLSDLQNEGKQQNNCVGYNYNYEIARGLTFIYFIRYKNSPNKSFITCQVNTKGKTIQSKRKNNVSINTADKKLIQRIDEVLKANFNKG